MSQRPFLTSLGITELDQARAPTASVFPTSFNEGARYIWESVIPLVIESGDSLMDWGTAIKLYVEACEDQDVFPFNTPKPVNQDIHQMLVEARLDLLEFARSTSFWSVFKPRSVTKAVHLTAQGLTLDVCATFSSADPSLGQWATNQGFQFDDFASEYTRGLNTNTTVFVNLAENRVGYNVKIMAFPHVPGNDLPAREEIEAFVLKTMWGPIMRQHRFESLTQRLV